MCGMVILAGSGISVDMPANLPSWWGYNNALIDEIKRQALLLCPEADEELRCLDVERDMPVQCVSDIIVQLGAGSSYFPLLKLLDGSTPNANHLAAVELARQGRLDAIVTTNFDTLFEESFRREAVPLTVLFDDGDFAEPPFGAACQLLKVHGTVADEKTLIDTVTQKSQGLSIQKKSKLHDILAGAEIVVMGFSGADLDFDPDYIPFSSALANGGSVTWLNHHGSRLHPAVLALKEAWGEKFAVVEKGPDAFFAELGVPYEDLREGALQNAKAGACADDDWGSAHEEIRHVFSQPPLGPHVCVGYCLTLLAMTGFHAEAKKLADLYESRIDKESLDLPQIRGIHQLALQREREGDFSAAREWASVEIGSLEKDIASSESDTSGSSSGMCNHGGSLLELYSHMASAHLIRGKCAGWGDEDSFLSDIEKAEEYADKSQDRRVRGEVALGRALVDFALRNDTDALIDGLRHCRLLANSAGNMKELAEILIIECGQRLQLGEYAVTEKALGECARVLKNVGDYELSCAHLFFSADLYVRANREAEALAAMESLVSAVEKRRAISWASKAMELLTEGLRYGTQTAALLKRLAATVGMDPDETVEGYRDDDEQWWGGGVDIPRWIGERLPSDALRAILVRCEYLGDDASPAVHELCLLYVVQRKWARLLDLAECYMQVALTPDAKSKAHYCAGCAYRGLEQYGLAIKELQAALSIDGDIDDAFVCWTHIELARLYLIQDNRPMANEEYSNALSYRNGTTIPGWCLEACMAYVLELRRLRQWAEAKTKLEELLSICPDEREEGVRSVLAEVADEERRESRNGINLDAMTPEELATYAVDAYERDGDAAKAIGLLFEAKRRYGQRNNVSGTAKCENNIAGIYISKDRYVDAKAHLMESKRIYTEIGDIRNAMRQLAHIISLCRIGIRADDLASRAECDLPGYPTCPEKALLIHSLFLHYLSKHRLVEAAEYARQALMHKDLFVPFGNGYAVDADIINRAISEMKQFLSAYDTLTRKPKRKWLSDDEFNTALGEATRLYRVGSFDKSIEILDDLEKDAAGDAKRLGQIVGTRGNTYLNEGKCLKAVDDFRRAISLLDSAAEQGADVGALVLRAYNALSLALDQTGRTDEAMSLLEGLLEKAEASAETAGVVINLTNRYLEMSRESELDESVYRRLLDLLSQMLRVEGLGHEMLGNLHHTSGLLLYAGGELKRASSAFEEARHQFLVSNSEYTKAAEIMLKEVNRLLVQSHVLQEGE